METWRRHLVDLSLLLEEHANQTMVSAQAAVDSITDHVVALGIRNDVELRTKAKTEAMFDVLRDKIAGLPYVDVATIVAANGEIINFSRAFPAPPINLSDRDYFQLRRDNPDYGVFISKAVRNKVNGNWVFYFSRRLNDSQGRFLGLVVVGVSVNQFTQFYASLGRNLGEDASITLLRRDFFLLARWPHQDDMIGKQNLAGTSHQVVEVMKKTDAVIYSTGPSLSHAGSPVPRLAAVRVLKKFPLIINLTITDRLFLADWHQTTRLIATVSAGSMAALVFGAFFLLRIARQREQASMLLRDLTEQVPGKLFQLQLLPDGQFSLPYVNHGSLDVRTPGAEHLFDWSTFLACLYPEDREGMMMSIRGSVHSMQPLRADYRVVGTEGTISWWHVDAQPQKLSNGAILWHGYSADITERKLTEEQLRIAASVYRHTREGIMITDAHKTIINVNDAFSKITGYASDDVIGKSPKLLSSGNHDAAFYAAMWQSIDATGVWEGEIWNRRKNGETYPQHLVITSLKGPDGCVTNYVATLRDNSASRASEEEIRTLAFYDPLTHLPNRRLLVDRLEQALASCARTGNEGAILFIDLDNFKTLNDTLGHDFGDLLLEQVAHRLVACVREDDTVARLGGDEFVVVLEGLSTAAMEAAAQAEAVGEKIMALLSQPYRLGQHEHHSTPSIGITLFNRNQQGLDILFKQADIAMYQSKKAGRNTLRFFDPVMQETINARVAIESDLRKALENSQFQLHYQIQVDDSQRALGAEALIRWNHPKRGLVSPVQFIPLAEETGLILPIGQWVLETACAQIHRWQSDTRTRELVLAVNVSAKQFRQIDFVDQVTSAVQRHGINPGLLKLELTESMLQESIEDTIAVMNSLNQLGVRFSLDDFGTGYSSLQYLKRLPLEQLKIDQSFIRDLATDRSDEAIVRTILAMAQSLNLNVIAEGVETEIQRKLLLASGCTKYQGYLFGRPLPIEQFEEQLSRHE